MDLLAGVFRLVSETSTNTDKLEFWAALGIIVGVVLFTRGFQMLRFKQLIMNTPISKIRSASMGLVEIGGRAKGPRAIPAGITGEDCYYYRAMAWQLRQSGKNREWRQVACESLYVPFFVEDSTGRMLVDPQGAEFDIQRNFKDEFNTAFFSSSCDVLPGNVASFLDRNRVRFDASTRLEEYCIKPDSPLFVFGTLCADSDPLTWAPVPHLGAGASLQARSNFFGAGGALGWLGLNFRANAKVCDQAIAKAYASLIAQSITTEKPNVPSAPAAVWSEVSMNEPEVGRRFAGAMQGANSSRIASADVVADEPDHAAESSSSNAKTGSGFDMHSSVCLGKGMNGNPFMISWRSQREVVQSLAWKSALCIWGGPALTLASLYVLALCW